MYLKNYKSTYLMEILTKKEVLGLVAEVTIEVISLIKQRHPGFSLILITDFNFSGGIVTKTGDGVEVTAKDSEEGVLLGTHQQWVGTRSSPQEGAARTQHRHRFCICDGYTHTKTHTHTHTHTYTHTHTHTHTYTHTHTCMV